MAALIKRLRRAWRSAPNRMALMNAVRGTVAIMVPLLALIHLGQPAGAVMAAIGGMNTAMSDAGGAYRRRMLVMLLVAALGAVSLFLGCQMYGIGWLAAGVLFLIAFAAGMARVFGQPGISLGLDASIAFLVGALAPQGVREGLQLAGYYVLGSLWTILFTLTLWRVRPYRRLFQQVATCYEACADLVSVLTTHAGLHGRRYMRSAHRTLREVLRQADDILETTRAGAGHSNPVFDRCVELLHAVSREGAAAVSLRLMAPPAHEAPVVDAWRAALLSWRNALCAAAGVLLRWKGQVPVAEVRERFAALEQQSGMPSAARPPLQLALLHLESAAEALGKLTGARFTFRGWAPRIGWSGLRHMGATFAEQFNFHSFIFRHALRVAVAAAVAQWLAFSLSLTHRLWMPMTVIVVLQPEFGATWRRMWQRVGGTLAGVLIAGVLHFLLHDSAAESVVIAVCAFGMFLFIRRHYGVGVTMLTPMVLLLLGVLVPRSGALILARGTDTILGAALALAAAFLLWPVWQKGAFRPQCRTALEANREFLSAVLTAARTGKTVCIEVMQARQRAERETDNADAVFQRMLSEPVHTRGRMRPALAFTAYLRQLTEHVLALALALEGRTIPAAAEALGESLLARLDAAGHALADDGLPASDSGLSSQLAMVVETAPTLAPWFERLVPDVTALSAIAGKL
ncbi:MAG TPA: FUSC family protein [Gammaproteobacteria bacterium]|nr:FUSC family protein [Gammaproteobacteria bacterium]